MSEFLDHVREEVTDDDKIGDGNTEAFGGYGQVD